MALATQTHAAPSRDKVPLAAKAAYGFGGLIDIFGHYLYAFLVNPVFNVQLGLSPARIGDVMMLSRLVDAFTDPFFGSLSDNARTRYGRRRPFILIGSILASLALPCLFLAPASWSHDGIFWFMLVSLALYAPLISCFNMPYQSLGAEMTPDYHERTTVQTWKAVVQQFGGMACNWAMAFTTCSLFLLPNGSPDARRGAFWAAAIAGAVMMLAGIANVLFVRERYYHNAAKQERIGMLRSLRLTFTCKPFLVLLGIALVYAVPMGIANTLRFYTTVYHVFSGELASGTMMLGWTATAYAVCGFLGVPGAAWLSRRYGKKKALGGALILGMASFGSTYWFYTPAAPWLMFVSYGLEGFATTGFWLLLPSMCADVVDFDELRGGLRREGAFASSFSWVLKLAMSLSMGVGGRLIVATGFDASLGNQQPEGAVWGLRILYACIPVAALTVAWVLLQAFPLTQEKMQEIRASLEARRGTV